MAVILVTGYSSVNSAIRSIQLRVVAYMVKSLKFDELLANVKASIERTRTYHAVCNTKQRLEESVEVLEKTKKAFKSKDLGILRKKLKVLVEEKS